MGHKQCSKDPSTLDRLRSCVFTKRFVVDTCTYAYHIGSYINGTLAESKENAEQRKLLTACNSAIK